VVNKTQHIILEISKELIWWIMSAVAAYLIMLPITTRVAYTSVWINGVLIVIALTYFRYAVFLRQIFVLRTKWVRFALSAFNVNFFVYILRRLQGFMAIYDSYTVDDLGKALHPPLPVEDIYPLFKYFYFEITLTVTSCLVLIVALTVRMVLAYWGTARMRLNAGSEQ
jgi:hypothetical protein